ncbi:hypothetical protein GZ59_24570 [Pectobacterium atrosepticum]|uniref:DUF1804 family protein n=1 Tax=Pectobacterium atrosepticum TaxID=29471 RepID=UPI0004E85BDB|nr:DUF1804 family protein [Pectobacterium atrosepticum]AIK14254.1 hypothetical protein GZ59_24570 [Pectobacterium atrosepticum]ATY91681.1 DUF1804 domain-containing protein [Pectobacterium atrosepticum]KFX13259.1 DNA-binding protein [Pectobacterium atrosepticum]KMK81974.1 hypothetical protein KCQ_08016 [Pectobacterium atrosepticum ICMP 1526]QXE15249.1 DUF1804 family protein [Pectobacterium atrosepticum]
MAHPQEVRGKLRRAYIFGQMSLEIASAQSGVAFATARRWKKDAQDAGDDWDKLRAAHVIAGGGLEEIGRAVLTGLVTQYQTTLEMLNGAADIPPRERVELLASLADAFNKATSASKKILPETSELSVALEVIQLLSTFIRERHSKHLDAFVSILDGFGEEIGKRYG